MYTKYTLYTLKKSTSNILHIKCTAAYDMNVCKVIMYSSVIDVDIDNDEFVNIQPDGFTQLQSI